MNTTPILGVIGGSGLYEYPGLVNTSEYDVNTPFGKPSAPIMIGELEGRKVAFLARHGIGHTFNPTEVNYRANIYALKSLGIRRIISISACGSLREDFSPGDIVIPNQLVDFTRNRQRSFFGEGIVAHVGVADPFCQQTSELLLRSFTNIPVVVHKGGTYIAIEGPRFSTKAESHLYRSWGMSIIGMTACPEAFLAREAEMCYATMAHVTDYDVWHVNEQPVTVEMVINTLKKNTSNAQNAIRELVKSLPETYTCSCHAALKDAVMTQPNMINANAKAKTALFFDESRT